MFQRIIKNSLLAGVPFGFFMGLFSAWFFSDGEYMALIGLFTGIPAGLFFGFIAALFAEIMRKKMAASDGTSKAKR